MLSSEGGSASDAKHQNSNKRLTEIGQQLKENRLKAQAGRESSDNDIPVKGPPVVTPKKKSSAMTRVVSSVALLGSMTLCYNMGHLYYSLLLIAFGSRCYWELININRHEFKDSQNKLINVIEAMPPLMQGFYLLPKTLIRRVLVDNDSLINFKEEHTTLYNILFVHHTVICAASMVVCLLLFTLSLNKGQYKY